MLNKLQHTLSMKQLLEYIVNTLHQNVLVRTLEQPMILLYMVQLNSANHKLLLRTVRYSIYSMKNYTKIRIHNKLPVLLNNNHQIIVTLLMSQMNMYTKKIITLSDLLSELMMTMVMMGMIMHLHQQKAFIHLLACTECLCMRC